MVPDLLAVARADGHAEVRAALAAREAAVLGLAVHAHGRERDTEHLGDARVEAVVGVRGLDGLEEADLRGGEDGEAEGRGVRAGEGVLREG